MSITERMSACQILASRSSVHVYSQRFAAQNLPADTLADAAQAAIREFTADPLLLPEPARPIQIYVIPAPVNVRWETVPFLEEREMFERVAYVYLPPDLLRRPRWRGELRYIIARALLRGHRPDPPLPAVAFEEALALFAAALGEIAIEGEPRVLPAESLDSPRNTSGAHALLEYVWMDKGSHFLRRLWDNGADGLAAAIDRTFALPAGEILQQFFLWAAQHGLLESDGDPSTAAGVLDHAAYWLGSAPRRHLDIRRGRNATQLRAFLLSPPGTLGWKHGPIELPGRPGSPFTDTLLVMNCGHRARGSFPCHDGARWSVSLD